MAQILLVEPEHPKTWGRYNQYHGLLKIGAWHKRHKDSVSYRVGCGETELPKSVDTIYVSSLFSYWEPYYLKSLAFYRQRYPKARVVFGGVHAINAHERVKQWEERLDIEVRPLFPKAVDEIPDITLIGSHFASLLTSRGCPNNCSYCSSRNVYGPGWKPRPIDDVVEEILVQVGRGAKEIAIYDDNFLHKAQSHAIPLLERIVQLRSEKRLKSVTFLIPSGFQASHLTEEIARLMKKAGFTRPLATSLESVDAAICKRMNRGKWSDTDTLRRCVECLTKAGYKSSDVTVYFLCGLPYQTVDDMLNTAVFIGSLGCYACMQRFSPIPGTRDFTLCGDNILSADMAALEGNRYVAPNQTNFTSADLKAIERYVRWQNVGAVYSHVNFFGKNDTVVDAAFEKAVRAMKEIGKNGQSPRQDRKPSPSNTRTGIVQKQSPRREDSQLGKRIDQPYQLLPELPSWEFEALKESIRRYGVLLPVVKDERGRTIDGHHRERACKELGVRDYPVITLQGLTEEQKRDHALLLNLVRRKVTRSQLREIIAAELRRTPDISSSWLAEILGTTDKTIESVRAALIRTSEIPKCETHRGKDGRRQRVTRVVTFRERDAQRAREALTALGDDAPGRPTELRLVERRARKKEKLEEIEGRLKRPRHEDDIQLYHCPMQKLERMAGIEPGTVDLVLTDIPYGREFLPQLPDLATLAETVLTDGGILCSYCGVAYLDHVLRGFSERLTYRAVGFSSWSGDGPVLQHLRCVTQATPVVIFSKGSWQIKSRWYNHYRCDHPEQDLHPWQKVLDDMAHWVESFTVSGGLVCDPLAGSFTTAIACEKMARRFVGCDQERRNVLIGQRRLRENRSATA